MNEETLEPLKFKSEKEAADYVSLHGILGFPHDSGIDEWIIVCHSPIMGILLSIE